MHVGVCSLVFCSFTRLNALLGCSSVETLVYSFARLNALLSFRCFTRFCALLVQPLYSFVCLFVSMLWFKRFTRFNALFQRLLVCSFDCLLVSMLCSFKRLLVSMLCLFKRLLVCLFDRFNALLVQTFARLFVCSFQCCTRLLVQTTLVCSFARLRFAVYWLAVVTLEASKICPIQMGHRSRGVGKMGDFSRCVFRGFFAKVAIMSFPIFLSKSSCKNHPKKRSKNHTRTKLSRSLQTKKGGVCEQAGGGKIFLCRQCALRAFTEQKFQFSLIYSYLSIK